MLARLVVAASQVLKDAAHQGSSLIFSPLVKRAHFFPAAHRKRSTQVNIQRSNHGFHAAAMEIDQGT